VCVEKLARQASPALTGKPGFMTSSTIFLSIDGLNFQKENIIIAVVVVGIVAAAAAIQHKRPQSSS